MSVQVLCPFMNWGFFLLLRYLSHLYVLGINPFSNINLQLVSTFSHFVGCLFTTCWPVALGFICCNTKALNFSSLFFLLRLLFCFCFCSFNLSLILITSIKSLLWFWLKFQMTQRKKYIAKYDLLCLKSLVEDSIQEWGINVLTCQREVSDNLPLKWP